MLPTLKTTTRVGIEAPATIAIPPTSLLPKHPGNNWDDAAFKDKHGKSQGLNKERLGDVGTVYQQTYVKKAPRPPDMTESGRMLLTCLNSTQATLVEDEESKYIDLDGKVLRFYGYWKEASVESPAETSRLRKVVIYVYPHDETVMVIEPRIPNSGIQGGTLIKRHRIPAGLATARQRARERNPADRIPCEDLEKGEEHLNPNDFNVGKDVTIYGKCTHIVDCDPFTREFLTALDVEVGEPEPYPDEEYFENYRAKQAMKNPKNYSDYDLRKTFEHSAKGRIVSHYPTEIKRVQRFLKGDNEVCRFWAYWDDLENPHGDLRNFEIRYYIQDDTMQVLERLPVNSGREPARAFCAKRRLPKNGGNASDLTFAARANGFRHDAPSGMSEDEYYYNLRDLYIGSTVKVFGREFVIYAVDPWTREYLLKTEGIELEPDRDFAAMTQRPPPPTLKPPKHNGFGTEEDSLGNCKSLVLRAPRQDIAKWQQHADTLLRFRMKLHNPSDANNEMRRFILTFYLADDTLMINEVSIKNTGFMAGRFLKRQKVKKFKGEGAHCYYSQEDIEPGKVISVCGHVFEVLEMDAFTETFKGSDMVESPEVTPERVQQLADQLRKAITTKHVTLTEAFRHYDCDRDGFLPLHEVADMFKNLNIKATQPELIALMTHFDTAKAGRLNVNAFVTGITGNTVKSLLDGAEAEYGIPKTEKDEEQEMKYRGIASRRPHEALRDKVLKTFKEKLESRQINLFEMYRMLSTMPSAHRRQTKDTAALTNGGTDSLLGPVQLRRGITERFSFGFSDTELDLLTSFFFPNLPKTLYDAPREDTVGHRLSLPAFQAKWAELERIGQLSPDLSLKESNVNKKYRN
eukprot:TRINITY_DN16925_c0_g1_i1.p1 TRINITY_DN16925_c0_g1~~TRINITY_DN16925_c0_g1_i1.p1  ORF type:complete len:859 (+),score=307.76 TRINITY_DN16925_c0_g1_i1:75-2651(+)